MSQADKPLAPEALLAELLKAASAPDALEALCRNHADTIRQHFSSWLKAPPALRERADLLNTYVQSIAAVANVFASKLDDPSLWQTLTGPPDKNPIARWDAELDQARALMGELRLQEAAARLTDLAIDVGRVKGSAVDAYMPVVLGTLGECHFQSGQAERSLEPTQLALGLVRKTNDVEGILAYTGNLYEAHRYLGQPDKAARYADEIAALYEQRGEGEMANRYRNQARLVRAGEPPLRVVLDVSGRRVELDEALKGIEGSVRFLFERNRLALHPSNVLTQQGRREGSQAHYHEALDLFQQAMKADPFNPQPVYEAAMTLMFLGRPADAAEHYERTEELAPGWFHCRSEGWLARQILAERYPVEVFRTLHQVQDGPLHPSVKMQMVRRALKDMPDLAVMHHQQGKLHVEAQQQAESVAAFRRGLECAEEPDIETRLLVDLAAAASDDDERKALCERARAVNGNLVAAATAAVVLAFG